MIEENEKRITLYTDISSFAAELIDVAKLFFPNTLIIQVFENTTADIVHQFTENNGNFTNISTYKGVKESNNIVLQPNFTLLEKKRYMKRYAKLSLYRCLKKHFNVDLPWGALTGIRPTKLAYEITNNENADFKEVFRDLFDVNQDKIILVDDILKQQESYKTFDDKDVDIYVGIPFCVSRCSYCSFTSGEIDRLRKYVSPYVSKLEYEIDKTMQIVKDNSLIVKNVYFGGGTPTSLSAIELDKILNHFDFSIQEFTVEAGRPDTITKEKLDVLSNHGVDRISINPQTFNQNTLDIVGRKHSVQDIFDKYKLARKYGFLINMDLIAGLPNEDFDMFMYSVNQAIDLNPDNITVHTLALKNGSKLKEQNCVITHEDMVTKMVDSSHSLLYRHDYLPYYMYRQKYVSANLENVGFCHKNALCQYNVDIMEETTSILACGCNAISKRVFNSENRLERQANPKDIITYLDRLDEFISRKEKLFSNN